MPALPDPRDWWLPPPSNLRLNNSTHVNNTLSTGLNVVCAWPVSGQYGAGSRFSFYALVILLLITRRFGAAREASLTTALLFPAVAGVHGILLAIFHVDGAVDLDIFGAFQLCSVGVVTIPLVFRVSKTYFHGGGRIVMRVLTGLILAGQICLAVEFSRIKQTYCTHDDYGNLLSTKQEAFPFEHATCGLICTTESGPKSPMRGGNGDDIYVIPRPDIPFLGGALSVSTLCCAFAAIPFVWLFRSCSTYRPDRSREPNDETRSSYINWTNYSTLILLNLLEIFIFLSLSCPVLVAGEINFFSAPMFYRSEPFGNVGQWGPVFTICIGIVGPFYMFWSAQRQNGNDAQGSERVPSAATLPYESSRSSNVLNQSNTSVEKNGDPHIAGKELNRAALLDVFGSNSALRNLSRRRSI